MSSPFQPGPEAVRAALAAITASPGFANSDRMVRFLRHVVEKSLAGEAGEIKEYTLGVEVFDRDASFDPKSETIVRVEARRLRKKLQEYYDGPGQGDAVRIELPGPGYAPVFAGVAAPAPAKRVPWIPIAMGFVVVALGAGYWLTRPVPGPELRSVAVLPFANLSGDANLEYFSDGFTEEVIDQLASIPDLHVAARTSAFGFKNKGQDVREIAQQLGVDALVEGSIRRGGNTVRVTAQLIRASDGIHIWSKSWDRELKDVLALETELAGLIAQSFQRSLKADPAKAPSSLEAHDLYLLGRYHWNREEPAELEKAIEYFNQAIAKSPDYALAYSGLSEVYSYQIDLDYLPTKEVAPKAHAAVDKALALDDTLAEAHVSRGLVAMDADWDFATAGREFERAMQLKPGYAHSVHWYAHYLENLGRPADGLMQMQRAIALDPLSNMYQLDVAGNFFLQRLFEQSLAQVERARKLDPQWPMFDLAESAALLGKGDAPRAAEAARKASQALGPMPLAMVILIEAEAAAGNQAAARAEFAKMEQAAQQGYVPAFAFALAHYALGNRNDGYQWLQRALEQRNGALIWLRNWPLFDAARKDPRAQALLESIQKNPSTP